MRVSLEDAAVGTGLGAAVPPIRLVVDGRIPVVIAVESDERPLLVSMLLGGRLRPDSGRVLVDEAEDEAGLRNRTAVVDAPIASEPSPGIRLKTIVAEELSFASLPTSRRAVSDFLVRHRLEDYANLPVRALPATDRIRLLAELAVLRHGVESLVVTSPERHGGAPGEWYRPLVAIAERGVTVAIVTDLATANILLALGARDGAEPQQPEATPTETVASDIAESSRP